MRTNRRTFLILHKGDELAVVVTETRVWTEPHAEDPGRLKAVPVPDYVKSRLAGP